MHHPTLAFIGAGNMAKAIIGGLVRNGFPAENIITSDPGEEKRQTLAQEFNILTTNDNRQAAQSADIIILAVKPWNIPLVCEEIIDLVEQQLIVSIAAGKTTSSIGQYLGNFNRIIRAMPNTPCLIGKGMTGLFANSDVKQEDRDFINSLFENIGETTWLTDESQIDIITALSGSGPAYYFYLTEALIKAGINLGLSEDTATKLVTQTGLGSVAILADQPEQTAAHLRKAVTSPKGTTEAAITVFDDNQLMDIISKAVHSATKRGQEMSADSK
ncbi:MAG: pyrroline-5-carboxylate reductase [Gammaproteobacteria bacterium]|nr:pyrroline-5-carboxylate reductase [Gammaproteobacteria bacterium]